MTPASPFSVTISLVLLCGTASEGSEVPVSGKAGVFPDEKLTVGGQVREYRLVVPQSVDLAKPAPLVFAFHGMGVDSKDFMPKYTGLDDLAAKHGFILVYPNALGGASWALTPRKAKDDLAFFDALLAKTRADYRVDGDRIYLVGMSNGAYFTNFVAIERSASIAAIASHSGSLGVLGILGPRAKRKYPVMVIHGTDDRLIPVEQGRKMRDAYLKEGHLVDYIEVKGLGHTWASSININDKIWAFFAKHTLRGKGK
jgi:polyhydroxybutyrate depolymerase